MIRTRDIVTEEVVNREAMTYAMKVRHCDWKALKMIMVATAEITASALGTPLEGSLMNDDGTWVTE